MQLYMYGDGLRNGIYGVADHMVAEILHIVWWVILFWATLYILYLNLNRDKALSLFHNGNFISRIPVEILLGFWNRNFQYERGRKLYNSKCLVWCTFSEKDQHAKHLQDLEDDMESQMQKAIQRVRSEVTRPWPRYLTPSWPSYHRYRDTVLSWASNVI